MTLCKAHKDHKIEGSPKHCPECGGETVENEETLMGKCTACEAMATAPEQKFCGECGKPMAKAAEVIKAEYEGSLTALDQLAAANERLAAEPDIPETPPDPETQDLLNKAAQAGEAGGQPVDAAPILAQFCAAANRTADVALAAANESRAVRKEYGLLIKAFANFGKQARAETEMLKANIAALKGEIENLSSQRRGSRTLQLVTQERQLAGGNPTASKPLNKGQIMVKAHELQGIGVLTANDVIGAEALLNEPDCTLDMIRYHVPKLAAACDAAA